MQIDEPPHDLFFGDLVGVVAMGGMFSISYRETGDEDINFPYTCRSDGHHHTGLEKTESRRCVFFLTLPSGRVRD